ncbi:hypothetical protein QE152_g12750 [Popillia japonica]|uniref:Ig-like domain-containing protein n=1 Tax=Popillia japonica TaxID=7064 RepID=A0AAW1LHN3_POPJA
MRAQHLCLFLLCASYMVDFGETRRGRTRSRAKYLCLFLLCASYMVDFGETRRGRTRSRAKSKFQIGLPITGKYRDPESDLYYNNKNGAKILMASHFDYEYVLGHKIAFICLASGNPRPHITWYKDGSEIFSHHYLNIHEWRIGTEKVKSKLEIDPATQNWNRKS